VLNGFSNYKVKQGERRNMKSINFKIMTYIVLMTFAFTVPAYADENVMALVADLQKQINSMKTTIDSQQSEIKDLRKKGGAYKAVPTEVSGDFADQLHSAIGPADKWLKGLNFKSDLRLRYEGIEERDKALADRNRFRYRLRLGVEKKFNNEMKVGFRLVSGDLGAITSTNETFDSNFDFQGINIDRVYATYTPEWAVFGPVKGLEITAGKFTNPLKDYTAKMIWDSDVTPEGIYERIELGLIKNDSFESNLNLIGGQFILEEGGGKGNDDAEMVSFTVAFDNKIKLGDAKPIKTKHALTYYDYQDFTLPGNFAATGGNFTGTLPVPGTYLAAGDFNILEYYNEIGFQIGDLPSMKTYFDFAHNTNEGAQVGRGKDENIAWNIGLKIGKAKKKGDWQLGYEYIHVGANSVPGVFVDSDFGGADRRGSVFKGAYQLTDDLQLGAAAFFTNRITAAALTADEERRLFQVDLVWKF